MREHDNFVLPGLVFVRGKDAAEDRTRSQDMKAVGRHAQSIETLGIVRAREIQHNVVVGRETLERCSLLAPIKKHTGRYRILLAGTGCFEQLHELPWLLIRQWFEEQGVHDAKYCRVCSDTQRERKNGNSREAGVLQQLAEGEPKIIHGAKPPSDGLA